MPSVVVVPPLPSTILNLGSVFETAVIRIVGNYRRYTYGGGVVSGFGDVYHMYDVELVALLKFKETPIPPTPQKK